MNYVNAAPRTLFAAFASTTITVVMAASIIVGMAGLPTHAGNPQMASAQVHIRG